MTAETCTIIRLELELWDEQAGTSTPLCGLNFDGAELVEFKEAALSELTKGVLDVNPDLMIKRFVYVDEEGDWCTLDSETLPDALAFVEAVGLGVGLLRLRVIPEGTAEAAASPAAVPAAAAAAQTLTDEVPIAPSTAAAASAVAAGAAEEADVSKATEPREEPGSPEEMEPLLGDHNEELDSLLAGEKEAVVPAVPEPLKESLDLEAPEQPTGAGTDPSGTDVSSASSSSAAHAPSFMEAIAMAMLNQWTHSVDMHVLLPRLAGLALHLIQRSQHPALYVLIELFLSFQEGLHGPQDIGHALPKLVAVARELPPGTAASLFEEFKQEAHRIIGELSGSSSQASQASSSSAAPASGSLGGQEATTHWNVTCDHCGVSPIIGRRYKNLELDDYDLCQECFEDCERNPSCWVEVKKDAKSQPFLPPARASPAAEAEAEAPADSAASAAAAAVVTSTHQESGTVAQTEHEAATSTEAQTDCEQGTSSEAQTDRGQEVSSEAQTDRGQEACAEAQTDREQEVSSEVQTDRGQEMCAEAQTDRQQEVSAEAQTDREQEVSSEVQTDREPGTSSEAQTDQEQELCAAAQTDRQQEISSAAQTDHDQETSTAAQTERGQETSTGAQTDDEQAKSEDGCVQTDEPEKDTQQLEEVDEAETAADLAVLMSEGVDVCAAVLAQLAGHQDEAVRRAVARLAKQAAETCRRGRAQAPTPAVSETEAPVPMVEGTTPEELPLTMESSDEEVHKVGPATPPELLGWSIVDIVDDEEEEGEAQQQP